MLCVLVCPAELCARWLGVRFGIGFGFAIDGHVEIETLGIVGLKRGFALGFRGCEEFGIALGFAGCEGIGTMGTVAVAVVVEAVLVEPGACGFDEVAAESWQHSCCKHWNECGAGKI